jgi:hypothetical protein
LFCTSKTEGMYCGLQEEYFSFYSFIFAVIIIKMLPYEKRCGPFKSGNS